MQKAATLATLPLVFITLISTLSESQCGTVCTPGETGVCHCDTGTVGETVCDASGSSWGECICDTPPVGDDDATSVADTPTPGPDMGFAATLEANPSCTISCIVRWTTDVPASSWVTFGSSAPDALRIGDDTLTTAHEVVVVGMTQSSSYHLQAVSRTATGETLRSQEMTFQTGALPYAWLSGDLIVLDEGQTQGGWTLYNVVRAQMSSGPQGVVMVDMKGQTVWYYLQEIEQVRVDVQVSWLDGAVLVGPGVSVGEPIFMVDLAGQKVWEGPVQAGSTMMSDGAMHHFLQPLSNGNILAVLVDAETVDGVDISSEILREFDLNNQTVWTWSALDHTDQIPLEPSAGGEWLHVNSGTVDVNANMAYMSSYFMQAGYKIDKSDGHVVWTLGKDGDFAPDPTNKYPWFGGLHSFEPLGDGRYLLYDNGDIGRNFSRALMYSLDETTMQARIIWEYPGPVDDHWHNTAMGDVDLLPNGNVLVLGGGESVDDPTRIMEITPAGQKVWHFNLYAQKHMVGAAFQAFRLPALATPIE